MWTWRMLVNEQDSRKTKCTFLFMVLPQWINYTEHWLLCMQGPPRDAYSTRRIYDLQTMTAALSKWGEINKKNKHGKTIR